jgi:protein SCO1
MTTLQHNAEIPALLADAEVTPKLVTVRRRDALLIATGFVVGLAGAPQSALAWHSTDISGALPALNFIMTRAADGKQVSAADYKDKICFLYFGYASCPDICPTTLLNLTTVLKRLGPLADNVRVLFVTVDPNRDTLDVLKQYTGAFAPQTIGLRGTPDQLAELAKRYRVAYSVEPATKDHPYEVTHSSAVYVFDRTGEVRLLVSGLATANPDLRGLADDLRSMIGQSDHPSLWERILHMI